ncbi:MAG: diguanylate cyclase [Rubrobacter sp.]|nr:diguanylate cyclase [Rubrobacter sp.]
MRLTLSGGVSRCSSEQDVQKCFGTADEALRRAKQQGRSRIVYDV